MASRRPVAPSPRAGLREAVREARGRNPDPSGAVIDSQAVKGSGVGGPQRGYDGAKRLSGSKRHLLVDTNGSVLSAHTSMPQACTTETVRRSFSTTSWLRSCPG